MSASISADPVALSPPQGARRRWLWALVALPIVAVGAWAGTRLRAKATAPATFDTVTVTRGDLQARVTATGILSAIVTVQVGAQVSGRIQQLFADFNSVVKRDQIIATIDPSLFRAEVEQARANDLQARANVAKAAAQLANDRRAAARSHELFLQKLIAPSDDELASTTVQVDTASLAAARGTVEQTRAALSVAELNLSYCDIRSPIDGTVISRNVDVGQTVASTLQAPTIFVIAQDLRRMQVDTNVAEGDVGRLGVGMAADFTVDAYPGEIFHGHIRQVRNAAQIISNVVTYDAVIDIENPELKLRPSMTANTTIIYAERKDALLVPNAALRYRPLSAAVPQPAAAGERVVWVLRGPAPEPVSLALGVSDGTNTEALGGGISVGDKIVTEEVKRPGGGPGSFGRML